MNTVLSLTEAVEATKQGKVISEVKCPQCGEIATFGPWPEEWYFGGKFFREETYSCRNPECQWEEKIVTTFAIENARIREA